ncbi:MAG: DUF4185 domain-containing protein [Bacteroidales bacterium]|nr:DUF4185 domain-containing protein [Bacteroidales bacterium]
MKTFRFFLIALAAVTLYACQDPEDPENNTPATAEDMSFEATLTAIAGGPEAVFAKGDGITVFDTKAGNAFTAEGAGATATFKGKAIKSEAYAAVYPALQNTARYSGKAGASIPSNQTAVQNAAPAGGIAVAYTTDNKLPFKFVTALLKVNVPADQKILAVEVNAIGGEILAGDAKISLDANAAVEVTGSSKVVLSANSALGGVYYAVVAPATLASGYEITVTDVLSRRATITVEGQAKIEAGKTFELAALNNIQWSDDVENPNPTAVPGAALFKVSFNRAEFNMISDGGFENLNPDNIKALTNWQLPNEASAVEGHTGNTAIKIDNPTPGIWFQLAQTLSLRMGRTYQYSSYIKRTTPHMYNGVVSYLSGFRNEINGPDTYVEGADWTLYEYEFVQPQNDKWGDMFMGLWGDAGAYAILDDVKIVPKDYAGTSIETASTAAIETFNNKTFSEINAASKVIAFKGFDGKYVVAFAGITVDNAEYGNGVAIAESASLADGLSITKLIKSGIKPVSFLEPAEDELAIVPNAGFAKDGKLYIHYYALVGVNPENPDVWTVSRAGFVVSADGGATWTKCEGEWLSGERWVEASLFEKDGVLYMAGSYAGRNIGWFNTFGFARCELTKDFTDPTQWEYLTPQGWVDTEVGDLPVVLMGSNGEPALVYNAKWGRWMLIYRGILGGLVFRDADSIDGDWSGEKLLVADPEGGKLLAPSVLEVTADGDLILMATRE